MPFSYGAAVCLGRHLAWAELRLILARVIWAFDWEQAGRITQWERLKCFFLVEKEPVEVRLKMRNDLKA